MDSVQNTSASACPEWDTLAAFCRGRLPDDSLEGIAEHVSICFRCATILEDLQRGETLLSHLRRRAENPVVDEALCQGLAEKARAIAEAESLPATVSAANSPEAQTGPPLPMVFGPYLLLQRLGQGGMGVVYKARQETLKRLVAVKMIRTGMYANNEERQRFRREGEAIARIRHAHVVQIHEFSEHEGQPYFSMELLEGGTLANRLRAGALAQREAAALVRTLAQAVAAAHEQGIVHRDLKPGNVLFSAEGTAKITDFGLAKILDSDNSETLSDAILGTPVYMAPEQARGESRQIGPVTDMYALGAILYECLTGQPPFRGGSRSQTLELVRQGEPEPPSRRCPGLSRDLEAICLKCLEKEPIHRYASASVLAEDLDRWLRGEPTSVRPSGWSMRLWRRVRRHPRWVASAAALLLFAAITVLAGWWYRDPDRPIRAIQAELGRGRPQPLIGETRGPRWSRWCAGEATSQISVLGDGTFTLNAWQGALLELVPDPQLPHYRFRALVRHELGAQQTEIGIYVAHHPHAHSAGVVHQFVALTFYDIERDIDLWASNMAKNPRIPLQKPPGNPAMLDPHLYAERAPIPWMSGMHVGKRAYFDPVGIGSKEWRELTVEVTPEGVKGFWGDKAIGMLTGKKLVDRTNDYLITTLKSDPQDPFARGLVPIYAPRGGLGLYVQNGTAAFCRVVIEPLKEPE